MTVRSTIEIGSRSAQSYCNETDHETRHYHFNGALDKIGVCAMMAFGGAVVQVHKYQLQPDDVGEIWSRLIALSRTTRS